MSFGPRNAYYLRISQKNVLPVYLYLDDRHLDWMSDRILQHVLEDLRPNILQKLKDETDAHFGPGAPPNAAKGTVDTHRGDTYQFCYFLRKTQPHSVVMKTRTFVTAPRFTMPPPPVPSKSQRGKRKSKESAGQASKRRKTKGKGKESDPESEPEAVSSDEDEGPRLGTGDIEMSEETTEVDPVPFELDIEEEEKPKPDLKLNLQGFSIFGQCLCIVIEPWPAIPQGPSRAPSVARGISRLPSLAPSTNAPLRAQTPLFLPDYDDERERSVTPAFRDQTVPLVDDGSDDEQGGMMQFSQVLNSGAQFRAGALDEDEEMEDVLFGDADEVRELL
ncbi:hypothetical protein C8J56DRAFT_934315 [Mycena floridula]|nr:hypothetical protein C8J56DRAFT_934315 [Mycena floridula]